MDTTKVTEPSLASEVYNRLLTDITSGKYELRARLPPEGKLAELCGVSRPVLREALARLREDGMIASRRGSGNFVVRRPEAAVVDFVPIGSIADIQRCYEFRIDVESAIAAWAARRRSAVDLEDLERVHQKLDEDYKRNQLGVEADKEFHAIIARASGNPFYQRVHDALQQQVSFGMNLSRSLTLQAEPSRQALVFEEHQRILDAIRAEADEEAAAAMRHHISAARDRMFVGR